MDKPVGPTSHDVVRVVRRRLRVKRVGHGGTLDPFATGLLVVLVNRATRLFDYLSGLEKVYEGVIRLGERTDTDDHTGAVTQLSSAWRELDQGKIHAAMQTLVGRQTQRPPAYSAKKLRGQPAYKRVRRGEHVQLEPKEITVTTFECTGMVDQGVGFRVRVSTGTYVRALARDLGERLGCGAHLAELRRTGVGSFQVSDAVDASEATWIDVRPPAGLVGHLRRVVVDSDTRDAVCQGKVIGCDRSDIEGTTAVFADDELVAIAETLGDGLLHPRVVLRPTA